MAIEWQSNATVYSYRETVGGYSVSLVIAQSAYYPIWDWSTICRDEFDMIEFHEFGALYILDNAKRAAEEALARWRISAANKNTALTTSNKA